MADAFETEVKIECGFCLASGEDINNPKILPCTHVHCLGCLTASYNISGLVQCPLTLCRYGGYIGLRELPHYHMKQTICFLVHFYINLC